MTLQTSTCRRLALLVPLCALAAACGGGGGGDGACAARLVVSRVSVPLTVIPGSAIRVEGEGFDTACGAVKVRFTGARAGSEVGFDATAVPRSLNEIAVRADGLFMEGMGAAEGSFAGELAVVIEKGGREVGRASTGVAFDLAGTLAPRVDGASPADVTLRAPVSLAGDGFLAGDEGRSTAVLDGTFTPDGGAARPVAGRRAEVALVEENDRARGAFLFLPSLAGIAPGLFAGTVTVENAHAGGAVLASGAVQVSLRLGRSMVTRISPGETTLGGIITVEGAGFIGATGDETMTLRLDGTATPHGGEPLPVAGVELVGSFVDGGCVRYSIIPRAEGDALVAVDFGFGRGGFAGTVTPVLEYEGEAVEGYPADIAFTLGPVRQVVFVQFLPTFTDTLRLFGLRGVERHVEERVLAKMAEVYEGINVEFRSDWPVDYYPGGYAIVEISGPDPNGKGLFGYDNTPGKDVHNLRLHDRIGGLNAETQEDGYPGYGGIFIDSILCWSLRRPEGIVCPEGIDPEPLFDQVFDPVRSKEVVAGEYPSGGDPARTAAIAEAVRVLGNVVGDTAAHELGHSLGLAHPYGPPDLVHNEPPAPGCLMDAGAYRPFDERGELLGATPGKFCGDEKSYLQSILPIR